MHTQRIPKPVKSPSKLIYRETEGRKRGWPPQYSGAPSIAAAAFSFEGVGSKVADSGDDDLGGAAGDMTLIPPAQKLSG